MLPDHGSRTQKKEPAGVLQRRPAGDNGLHKGEVKAGTVFGERCFA